MKYLIQCPKFTDYLLINIGITIVVCVFVIHIYDRFIDRQIKNVVARPESKNKITFKVLAVGFGAAYGVMLLPMSKEALDFVVYSVKIELYSVTKALIFIGMITFGAITGGTQLANIKGRPE